MTVSGKPYILSPTLEQIEKLRADFFKKLDTEGAPGEGFHPNDVERVKTHNLWLQRFLEQHDLDHKNAFKMLWDTCKWRKEYGANELSFDNINMDYYRSGIFYIRGVDIDGKKLLLNRSILHERGGHDNKELLRVFFYWVEKVQREEDYDSFTLFFDLSNTGFAHIDLDFTKNVTNTLKWYYPNALNYIIINDMPWIMTATFKIIKGLMPPKSVACMRFLTPKTLSEYIPPEHTPFFCGGKDDFTFEHVDEKPQLNGHTTNGYNETNGIANGHDDINSKKVHFANLTESTMSDSQGSNYRNAIENGHLLKISPSDLIKFSKSGSELLGTINITNTSKNSVTYKIRTTSPEKFRIRPSTDILAPGNSMNVYVMLQNNVSLEQHKDKFLIMGMELNEKNATAQELTDLWKSTQNNDVSVEQHRLKCAYASDVTGTALTEITRNGGILSGSSSTIVDGDRQLVHLSNLVSQLVDSTKRLENRVKFNQKMQWITVLVFLLLSIAIVYILKIEIHNNSSEYCTKPNRFIK